MSNATDLLFMHGTLNEEIGERLRRIDVYMADLNSATPTWPLIGDLGHINEELGELEKFMKPVVYNA